MRRQRFYAALAIIATLYVVASSFGQTQLHPRSFVVTVAAADAPFAQRLSADYICDGTADEVQINAALARANVSAGQTTVATRPDHPATLIDITNEGPAVRLVSGSYQLAAAIDVSSYKFPQIEGSGQSTVVVMPPADHAIRGNWSADDGGESPTIKNLRIQGDGSSGYHGIYFTNARNMVLTDIEIYEAGLHGYVLAGSNWTVREDDSDDVADFAWVASASGTGEYYLVYMESQRAGKGIDHRLGKPENVTLDGSAASEATEALGSIPAGEWKWGDNDSIGYDTLYVRLSDDSKPDSGDVHYNAGFSGSAIVTNVVVRNSAKRGAVHRAIHDTTIVGSQFTSNTREGLVLDNTFNHNVSACGIEDNYTASGSGVGYRGINTLDTKLSTVTIENDAVISTANGSFEHWSNVALAGNGDGATGAVTISDDWSKINPGRYLFNGCRGGVFSAVDSTRIMMSSSTFTLGNIKTSTGMFTGCWFALNGTTSKMTISEAGADNDSAVSFASCYIKGDTSRNAYEIEASGNDSQSTTFAGGKIMTAAISFTKAGSEASVRVAMNGTSLRGSALNFTGVGYVAVSGCDAKGSGGAWTFDDVDNAIAITGNVTDNLPTITVNSTCAANGTFVGNADGPAGGSTTFSNSGTGTWVNANNAGVTGGS